MWLTSEFRIPGQHLQQLLAELNGRSHIRRLAHRGARVPSYVSSGLPEAMGPLQRMKSGNVGKRDLSKLCVPSSNLFVGKSLCGLLVIFETSFCRSCNQEIQVKVTVLVKFT